MSDTEEVDREGAVTVAYVHSNDCAMSWHHSIIEMLAFDMANEARIMRGGWIAIHAGTDGLVESRNLAITTFLKERRADWLFWVDTDMGFAADTLERLLEAADPVERPMVGALCFSLREVGPDGMGGYETRLAPTVFDWAKENGKYGFAVRWIYPENTLTRCGGTGSACILIHRSVFEAVEKEYGPVWYERVPNTTTGQLIGEDLSFCLRAGALSAPLHIHTGVEASHAKLNWLSSRQYAEQLQADAIKQRLLAQEPTAVIVPTRGRPGHAEPFMDSFRASGASNAKVYAVIQRGDPSIKAWRKAGATVLLGSAETFMEKANFAYRQTKEPWLLLTGDDVRFHEGWLAKAQQAALDAKASVIGTNDLANPRVTAGEHAVHWLLRREYIDSQGASWDGPGTVCHEGYRYWYADDELVSVAKQRGVWAMALDSVIEHLHPVWGTASDDETYRLGQPHVEEDKELFESRRRQFAPELEPVHA